MSPHHALPSLVMLPSPQLVSSVGQGLCWLRVHQPHEDVVGLETCMGMPPPPPPPLHFLNFISLLGYVSDNTRPSRVMLPSSQRVSLVGQWLLSAMQAMFA